MITLKINTAATHNFYLQASIVSCTKLKLEISMNVLGTIQKCLIFSNYSAKSKIYDNSKILFISKMKDETAGSATKEFFGLNSNIY